MYQMRLRTVLATGAIMGASLAGPGCSSGSPEATPKSEITPGQADSRSLKLADESMQKIAGKARQGMARVAFGQCLGWYTQGHKAYILAVNPAVESVNSPPETFEQIAVLVPPMSTDAGKLTAMPGPYSYVQSDKAGNQISSSNVTFSFDRFTYDATQTTAKDISFKIEETSLKALDSPFVARDTATGQVVMAAVALEQKPADFPMQCQTLVAGVSQK